MTDFSTDAGKVRLLISDIDTAAPILNDASVEAFLDVSGGNVKRAAAAALMVIAVNETLVQKRISLLDLRTDGPAEAEALRKLAVQYRAEADEEGARATGRRAAGRGRGKGQGVPGAGGRGVGGGWRQTAASVATGVPSAVVNAASMD